MKPENKNCSYIELTITKATIPFINTLLTTLTEDQNMIIDINGDWAKLKAVHESNENGYIASVDVYRKGYGTYGIRDLPKKYCYLETVLDSGISLAPKEENKWQYTEIIGEKIQIVFANIEVYRLLIESGYIVNHIDGYMFETNAKIVPNVDFYCGDKKIRMDNNGLVFPVI